MSGAVGNRTEEGDRTRDWLRIMAGFSDPSEMTTVERIHLNDVARLIEAARLVADAGDIFRHELPIDVTSTLGALRFALRPFDASKEPFR